MNTNSKVLNFVNKYTMIFALIAVVIFFSISTNGAILYPSNVSNLIAQNAYVFVLATGMLLCILTGGNIDLSVGSVVCFVGAVGATLMVSKNVHPVHVRSRYPDRCLAGILDRLCAYPSLYRDLVRNADLPWIK